MQETIEAQNLDRPLEVIRQLQTLDRVKVIPFV